MKTPGRKSLSKPVEDNKEDFNGDNNNNNDNNNNAFIKQLLLRPTKYDYILSVIDDYLILEATNFGMPPIAEYHMVRDTLGAEHVEKILISFVLDRL